MRDGQPLVVGEDVFPFRVTWLSADEYVYASNGKIRRRKLGDSAGTPIEFSATVPVSPPKYTRKAYAATDYKPKPVIGIGSPRLSPDGKSVVFRALNELYLMPIGGKPVAADQGRLPQVGPRLLAGRQASGLFERQGRQARHLDPRPGRPAADRQLTRLPDAAVSGSWSTTAS